MTTTQQKRLQDALTELVASEANAEQEDQNMARAESAYNEKAAPFGNDSRIAREGERITKEADAIMQQQNQALLSAKMAMNMQFEVAQKAHQRLDDAAQEYKNAGIAALQTGAIEKV